MKSEAEVEDYLQQLDAQGLLALQERIQQQLVAKIAAWFEQYEVGDEHPDGTSNLLVVELAGTEDDPYIYVGEGLVVYKLTREGPFQAEMGGQNPDEEAADYNQFEASYLAQMLLRLEKEAATY
ncbi:MAG: hypothetical protein EOO60_06565 [Hymenobacter sp.]|nr:MAG: hypothetical protein EOO60_06565 [Hymenobacter sp.]